MICTFCGPNVSCYEELYGDNPEIPFMIRFIGHEDSVAFVLFEVLIDNNKEEENDIISRSIRCSYCHNLVVVGKLCCEKIIENFNEA